jgi:hypothetical protein
MTWVELWSANSAGLVTDTGHRTRPSATVPATDEADAENHDALREDGNRGAAVG